MTDKYRVDMGSAGCVFESLPCELLSMHTVILIQVATLTFHYKFGSLQPTCYNKFSLQYKCSRFLDIKKHARMPHYMYFIAFSLAL